MEGNPKSDQSISNIMLISGHQKVGINILSKK